MAQQDLARLAVLIDADNTQPAIAEALLAEIAKFGVASVKRVYGDWTTSNLNGWKKVLLEHALHPIQQFAYTTGKNATDGAMIIDAMDLLYTQNFHGFCLVSSDSDFTGLAKRIRQNGLTVYGFGERKTPQALRSACDKFTYLDVLRGAAAKPPAAAAAEPVTKAAKPKVASKQAKASADKPPAQAPATAPVAAATPEPVPQPAEAERKSDARSDPELLRLFREALDDAADDAGWAALGAVGNLIAKRKPDFDSRNYGYKKLSELAAATGLFELDERKSADGKQKSLYLRALRKKA